MIYLVYPQRTAFHRKMSVWWWIGLMLIRGSWFMWLCYLCA